MADRNFTSSGWSTARRMYPALFLGGVGAVYGGIALTYPLGSVLRPGAGFLPVVLAAIMLLMAVTLCFLSTKYEPDQTPFSQSARPIAGVLGSFLIFGFAIERLGIVIAVFLLVFVSAVARSRTTIGEAALLAAGLSALATVIFVICLELPLSLGWW